MSLPKVIVNIKCLGDNILSIVSEAPCAELALYQGLHQHPPCMTGLILRTNPWGWYANCCHFAEKKTGGTERASHLLQVTQSRGPKASAGYLFIHSSAPSSTKNVLEFVTTPGKGR